MLPAPNGLPSLTDGVDFSGLELIAIFFDGTFLPALSNEGGASVAHERLFSTYVTVRGRGGGSVVAEL